MKSKNLSKYFNKNISVAVIATLVFLLGLFFIITNQIKEETIINEVTAGLAPTVATSYTQTNKYAVTAEPHRINGGAYLYQEEPAGMKNPKPSDLVWIADTVTGKLKIKNTSNNTPVTSTITAPIDLTKYSMPTTFKAENGRSFNRNVLNSTSVLSGEKDITFISSDGYDWRNAKAVKVGEAKLHVTYKTGTDYKYQTKEVFHTFSNGTKKHSIMYPTPFAVTWHGTVEETKEIKATPDFTTTVGASTQLKAEVRSKTGTQAWTQYYDKTTATSETSWRSDNPSVVSVDNKGKITAHKQGTATIHVNWKSSDGDYHITTKTVVTVGNSPAIQINGDTNVCFDKGETSFGAYYYDKNNPVAIEGLAETTWTSSDTSVATVSKGKVTFKKIGKTKITVTYKGISGL